MLPVIRLPRGLQLNLESSAGALLFTPQDKPVDFSRPLGETALLAADSLSWRIFKNPIALWVGGIAAVILELADPAVRTGVWEHSSFLKDPVGRLRRTGMAAMVTVYGARSCAEPLIAHVVRRHGRVVGRTPAGESFCANDAQLLNWVQATAGYGFGHAYSRYVTTLSRSDFDGLYAEGTTAAHLYGAAGAPQSSAEMDALFDSMRQRVEPSKIIFDFLEVMRSTPMLPAALRRLQPMLVGAAVDLIPNWIRACLGLTAAHGLAPYERACIKVAGAVADRIVLANGPPAQSCRRLGLPAAYLYLKQRRPSR